MLPPPSLYFTIEKRFLSVRASLSYIHKHYVIEFGKGVLLGSFRCDYKNKNSYEKHIQNNLKLNLMPAQFSNFTTRR